MDTEKPLCRRLRDLLIEAETVLDRSQHGQQKRRREDVQYTDAAIEAQTVVGTRMRWRRRYQSVARRDNTLSVDAALLQEALLLAMTQHAYGRTGVRTHIGSWRIRDIGLELGLLERSAANPLDCQYHDDERCTPTLPPVEGTRRVPAQLVVDLVKRLIVQQKWWMPKKAQGAKIRIISSPAGNLHLTNNGYLRPGTYASNHKSELDGFATGDFVTISTDARDKEVKTAQHHVVPGGTTVERVPITSHHGTFANDLQGATNMVNQMHTTLAEAHTPTQSATLTRDDVEQTLRIELSHRNNPRAMLADMIRSGRAVGPNMRYGVLEHEAADKRVVTILDTWDAQQYRFLVRNSVQPTWLQVLSVQWNDARKGYWLQLQNHKGHRKGFFIFDTEHLLFRSPTAPFGSFCFKRHKGSWVPESFKAAREATK